jgi:hypothetical protein
MLRKGTFILAACSVLYSFADAQVPTGGITAVVVTDELYFIAPDNSRVVVAAGVYDVDTPDGSSLRLVGAGNEFVVKAEKGTHKESLDSSSVFLIEESGLTHVIMLLPSGATLDAAAFPGGIQLRGTKRISLAASKTSRYYQNFRAGSIAVTAPNYRTRWTADKSYDITWQKSGAMNSTVRILLLKDQRVYQTIARSAPNSGRFTWNLPPNIEGRFMVAVITADNAVRDASALFGIVKPSVSAPAAMVQQQATAQQKMEGRVSVQEMVAQPSRYDQSIRVMRQTRPRAPTQIQVTASGRVADGSPWDYAILMWNDNASNESQFIIERRSLGAWEVVGSTSANESQFEDTTVDWSNATNWWRVRAQNLFGNSDYSNETYLSFLADPAHNPVGGTEVLTPESYADSCKASSGTWIGWGINHCSHAYQAVYGAIQTVTNPLVQVYKAYFWIVGSGSTKRSLPEDVIQALKPYYGETLLRNVEYGSSNHTSTDNTAMCNCMDIYFPSGSGVVASIKNGVILARNPDQSFTDPNRLHWLLHELQHAKQCADWGGRENYAIRWFGELSATTFEELITNPRKVSNQKLHNSMPMEGQAKAKADDVITFLSTNSNAKLSEAEFQQVGQQLAQYAQDLRNTGEAMKAHARAPMPKGLTESQMNSFVAKRSELVATADAALKLANGIERRGQKAQRRTLTRADMESLGQEADPLNRRINQKTARIPMRKSPGSVDLNVASRDVDPNTESIRNKRQMASTAFQNFDQKANQLYNILSSVLKAMNEMRMGTMRNML